MSVVLLSPPGAALSSSTCGLGSVRAERWLSHEVMNPTLERAPSMETSWGDESLSTIMSRAVFSGKFSWRFSEKHAGCQRRMSGSPVFVNRSLYRAGSRFPRIQERRRKEVERTSIDMFGLVLNEFMYLSPGCRAVELSRLRRAAVEAAVEVLSRPCLSSLSSSCRVAVEWLSNPSRQVEADSMRRCVEVCRGLSRSVELSSNVELLNSCLAVEPATHMHIALHEAL
jgi:hypothetical protein